MSLTLSRKKDRTEISQATQDSCCVGQVNIGPCSSEAVYKREVHKREACSLNSACLDTIRVKLPLLYLLQGMIKSSAGMSPNMVQAAKAGFYAGYALLFCFERRQFCSDKGSGRQRYEG